MDKTTLKMTMAGFFHDIGKLADKQALDITEGYINANSQYLKSTNGHFSHHHAVYTAAFIEQYKDDLPQECNSPGWGEGDGFVNLAAGHHNPYTPIQSIITEADWLSSGIDRDSFGQGDPGISPRQYKATRLLPLFEQLMQPLKENHEDFSWAYPLQPLSPQTIFPQSRKSFSSVDSRSEYIALFDGFVKELKLLKHRRTNIELWFEHFESLMLRYCSQLPAARAGKMVPDVSLYDHSRLTAAFSAALYLYHRDTGSLDIKSIHDRSHQKFLLLSGNFYGIQDFIFTSHGSSQKYRSKILRGRSFYVSLITELAADMLCREIGLAFINVIMNAAGRFTILAPNTTQTNRAIEKIAATVNQWLISIAFGEVSMGFAALEVSPNDFMPDRFNDIWEKLGRKIEAKKYMKFDIEKYSGTIAGYLDRFDNTLESPLCPLCGKRPADKSTGECLVSPQVAPTCPICQDQVRIGTLLVRKKHIIITDMQTAVPAKFKFLKEPIFGKYQLTFDSNPNEDNEPEHILKFWDISMAFETDSQCRVTRKFINGYVPLYSESDLSDPRFIQANSEDEDLPEDGSPKTFHHISALSRLWREDGKLVGLDALGALKADVDYLGMLMGCGLKERRFTISRIATLSRQLNYFFAFYLPYYLNREQRFNNIYTVFAGGDDLFLIGPWNRMFELTIELRKEFEKYVCENAEIHFSAGIALHKSHTPLNRLAEGAEKALENSKNKGRNRFTMFDKTALWNELSNLERIRDEIEKLLENGWITSGMLYRLNGLIELADREKEVFERKAAFMCEMDCLKWRALLSYSAQRNIGAAVKDKERKREIIHAVTPKLVAWLDKFKGSLRIPLWILLYNRR